MSYRGEHTELSSKGLNKVINVAPRVNQKLAFLGKITMVITGTKTTYNNSNIKLRAPGVILRN